MKYMQHLGQETYRGETTQVT